jgi:hypothetical protein
VEIFSRQLNGPVTLFQLVNLPPVHVLLDREFLFHEAYYITIFAGRHAHDLVPKENPIGLVRNRQASYAASYLQLRVKLQRPPLRLHDESADEEEDGGQAPPHGVPGGSSADILKMLGLGGAPASADPQVQKLVEAAAAGDLAEIDRLVTAGAEIKGLASLKQKAPSKSSLLRSQLRGGAGISLPLTPLMAALACKQIAAARRLIELGADLKAQHPFLGTPVHVAAFGGNVELLRLVLDAGGDPKAVNGQRQTPLEALQQFRQVLGQMTKLGHLGATFSKDVTAELEKMIPEAQALEGCEQLLREREG